MTGTHAARDADAIAGSILLRTFVGTRPTPHVLDAVRRGRAAGVTVFRHLNVESPAQVRDLVAELQCARPGGSPPLLIAFDQEGGQLQAVGEGATAWPGNLAIGATRSEDLARRAGRAIATEVAAMGGNVLYAPVCDVVAGRARGAIGGSGAIGDSSAIEGSGATRTRDAAGTGGPARTRDAAGSGAAMGTRPFGDDPALVARLAAAMVEGIQSTGVAATLKHFPGHGAAAGDSHHGTPALAADRAALDGRELVPFRAGIAAGCRLVMAGHLAVPALTGGRSVPATVSPELLRGLLRRELGYDGAIISDAMNMGGAGDQLRLPAIALEAVSAGIDLLLLLHDEATEDAVCDALAAAVAAGAPGAPILAATERVGRLRRSIAIAQPLLDVLDCAEHRALAREIAERSMTLVRDRAHLLPIDRSRFDRVVLLSPPPTDLTPAETSSTVRPALADALRRHGLAVDEIPTLLDPDPAEVAALAGAVHGRVDGPPWSIALVLTVDALDHPGQASLVERLERGGVPLIAIAVRGPRDLEAYPTAGTYACTYGIQAPSMHALADALAGRIGFPGLLPVELDAG